MQCDRVYWPSRRPSPLARFRARPYESLTNRQAARSMFSIRVWPIRVISPLSPLESKVLAGARANPSERERKMMNSPGRDSEPSRVLPGRTKKVGIDGLARNRQRTETDRADCLCIRARLEQASLSSRELSPQRQHRRCSAVHPPSTPPSPLAPRAAMSKPCWRGRRCRVNLLWSLSMGAVGAVCLC